LLSLIASLSERRKRETLDKHERRFPRYRPAISVDWTGCQNNRYLLVPHVIVAVLAQNVLDARHRVIHYLETQGRGFIRRGRYERASELKRQDPRVKSPNESPALAFDLGEAFDVSDSIASGESTRGSSSVHSIHNDNPEPVKFDSTRVNK